MNVEEMMVKKCMDKQGIGKDFDVMCGVIRDVVDKESVAAEEGKKEKEKEGKEEKVPEGTPPRRPRKLPVEFEASRPKKRRLTRGDGSTSGEQVTDVDEEAPPPKQARRIRIEDSETDGDGEVTERDLSSDTNSPELTIETVTTAFPAAAYCSDRAKRALLTMKPLPFLPTRPLVPKPVAPVVLSRREERQMSMKQLCEMFNVKPKLVL